MNGKWTATGQTPAVHSSTVLCKVKESSRPIDVGNENDITSKILQMEKVHEDRIPILKQICNESW